MRRSLLVVLMVSPLVAFAGGTGSTAWPSKAPAAAPAAAPVIAPSKPAVSYTTQAPAQAPMSSALPGEAAVRKAINTLAEGQQIDAVHLTPVPGLYEVDLPGDVVYVSADGKYVMTGNMVDVATRKDLTETSRATSRRALLKDITPSQMIVFAPSHPKYTVTVFTDVDCGYCRKLHSQIAEYNKAGIAVDYLFFPREGIGSPAYDKAISVWCSSDRQKAFTDAKKGLPIPKATCTNPVTMDYNLGIKVGVDGTPAVYAADGTQIGGYLSPAEMRASLDKLAAPPKT